MERSATDVHATLVSDGAARAVPEHDVLRHPLLSF